ncbi:energy transducer TonB [Novosphingobium lindaniclasticum]
MARVADQVSVTRKCMAAAMAAGFHVLLGAVLFMQWRLGPAPVQPPSPPVTVVRLKALPAAPVRILHPSRSKESREPPVPARTLPVAPAMAAPLPRLVLAPPMEFAPAALTFEPVRMAVDAVDVPPPPQPRKGDTTFEGLLLARIEEMRRYPADALSRRQQGVVQLRFRMNRKGEVLSAQVVGRSGFAALDAEALRMVRRAEPLPEIPRDRPDELDVSVPIEFSLNRRERFAQAN